MVETRKKKSIIRPATQTTHTLFPTHHITRSMQNMIILRFHNEALAPSWCRDHVANVQITFKEDFGTEGRGGYFDQYGK